MHILHTKQILTLLSFSILRPRLEPFAVRSICFTHKKRKLISKFEVLPGDSNMIRNILIKLFKPETVYAHCDIPCGVYDSYLIQYHALSVLRMTDLINQLDKNAPDYDHKYSRFTATKEEQAEKCKHETRIIFGDYFKPDIHGEHFKKASEVNHKIMLLGSKTRQTVDVNTANELVTATNDFAEIFWASKNKETTRMPAPYPVVAQMVVLKA